MAKLIFLTDTSWRQPFADRRKELPLWSSNTKVASFCGFKDGTKRLLNIKFESKFKIDETRYFQITSGNEISFSKDFQDKIGKIIFNNPDSFFIVTVLDSSDNSFSPSDIVWIKNVTNKDIGYAYMDLQENEFVLHFPNKFGKSNNLLKPKIDDIILVRQIINRIPVFTHLVTPIDNQRVDENTRAEYRYGRRVRVIAKTDLTNCIHVDSTLWKHVNFQGVSHGNACEIENISSIENLDELKLDIWRKSSRHFIQTAEDSASTTSAIIKKLQITNPDISVTEGELRLVKHMMKERNHEIVKQKKQQAIQMNTLKCEVCTFSFPKIYDANFIECHHIIPIGDSGVRKTTLEDLALVCANCHRMLHTKFNGQYLSIEQLSKLIKAIKKSLTDLE